MTTTERIEHAISDAINVFVRDVLKPGGYLNPEKMDKICRDELLQAKYKIAREWAAKWGGDDAYVHNETTPDDNTPEA